jgi:hypothetical protein
VPVMRVDLHTVAMPRPEHGVRVFGQVLVGD